MKKKCIVLAVLIVAAVMVGLGALRWDARYGGQNPIAVEKAKASIDRGRGYEVLAENRVFLTDEAHFSELMYFLEGHYGLVLASFDEDTAVLTGDYGGMTFHLTEIVSFGRRYYIWERAY